MTFRSLLMVRLTAGEAFRGGGLSFAKVESSIILCVTGVAVLDCGKSDGVDYSLRNTLDAKSGATMPRISCSSVEERQGSRKQMRPNPLLLGWNWFTIIRDSSLRFFQPLCTSLLIIGSLH
jgi:hypothetical protein